MYNMYFGNIPVAVSNCNDICTCAAAIHFFGVLYSVITPVILQIPATLQYQDNEDT